ncbi:hypothetical protein [Haloarcula quadrata]|uniref:hypothetical protein n=1 Tax=Haloarcula quadrata TaxID=182779 RepID=UPI001FC9B016|nr:hypothetical protein [Haloarcula quadrata]
MLAGQTGLDWTDSRCLTCISSAMGGCLGYLRNQDATAEGLRSRLRDARDELLRMTTDV